MSAPSTTTKRPRGSRGKNAKEMLACEEDILCAKNIKVKNKAPVAQEEPSLSEALHIIQNIELRETPGAHAICHYSPDRAALAASRADQSILAAAQQQRREDAHHHHAVHEAVVVASNTQDTTSETEAREAPGEEVVEAKILPESDDSDTNRTTARKRRVTWLALLAIFLVGLGALLVGLLSSSSSGGSTNISNSSNGNSKQATTYPPFRRGLPAATVKAVQDGYPDHPYYLANAWMWNDPSRRDYSVSRQWQRFHMVAFYYFTGGEQWFGQDDWLSYEVSECDWFSQHYNDSIVQYDDYPSPCDNDGVLIKLSLNSNNLQGVAPSFRALFPLVQTLDIGNNNLRGPPPDAFVGTLEVLVISHNQFQGHLIASGDFESVHIRVAKLNDNRLYGYNYGPLFALLTQLEILDLSNNHFDEILTENLGYCTKLTHLLGSGNRFHGTIPTQLGLLGDMQQMDWSGNANIHGQIPQELEGMTNLELWDLRGTSVAGKVPERMCDRIRNGDLLFLANCTMIDCC